MHDGSGYPAADDGGQARTQDGRCLTVRDLRVVVDGTALIDGLNLSLGPSGITVIMGQNGAGKTILLKVLHGLLEVTSGTVHWGGKPVSDATRARQSLVFQSPVLLRRSVAANIDFVLSSRGRRDADRRAALLDHVGLGDKARQPARLLSGGEKQRLALARALACEPSVLLLDEPTASLDPASVLRIEQIVREAEAAGTRILFVSHDIAQARRLAHDVVFLSRGQVVEHAPARTFFDAPATQVARDYLAGRIVV